MSAGTQKRSSKAASAQKRAAAEAEEVAKHLRSLASALKSLDVMTPARATPSVTPRNWWRVQAGRFRNDPTFPEFAKRVRASRKREG